MDGSRTLRQLQDALSDAAPQHVRKAVALLVDAGLVEDSGADDVDPPANAETLAFLRRFIGATRWNSSGQAAYERLRASEIVIVDSPRQGQMNALLRSTLLATGIGSVELVGRAALRATNPVAGGGAEPAFIVSLSSEGDDIQWHAELGDWCIEHQMPWLRAVMDEKGGYADLGPFFKAEGPCYGCFRKVHARPARPEPYNPPLVVKSEAAFWAGMVAIEIIYLLTRIGPLATGKGFRRYDLVSWESKDLACPRIPGCSRCRPTAAYTIRAPHGSDGADATDTAVVYSDYVGLQSRTVNDPASIHENLRLGQALSRQTKSLSICRQ
jgi:hypothetical protein